MRLAMAICLVLALVVPASAMDEYAQLVHRCVSTLTADPDLRTAASAAEAKVLRVVFTVDARGRVGKVSLSSANATINLRKMVERKFRGLPAMMPPPGGKARRFVLDLTV